MRRLIKTLTITTIAVGLVAGTVLAASNTTEVKKFEGENRSERPEKPENEVFGKITSIDANTITVTIAEMKKPEGRTNPPERNNRDDKNKNNNSMEDKPEINIDNMFTLTSTTKTYNISNADLIKFKKQEKNDNANNSSNKDANKDDRKKRTLEELEKDSKATYTDFAVGDYVSIELESSTSTTAKKVKSMDRMGDGFRMRKFYNQNRDNNNKNNIKQ